MLINHDLQDLHAEVAYRRDAMRRAAAGSRRRRRPDRRPAGDQGTRTNLRLPPEE